MSQSIDIVVPLSSQCKWGDQYELLYSLRSAEKNIPNLHKVFVVGEKPGWISDWVEYIPAKDELTRNKDGNLINKVRFACKREDLTDYFIRISDDQLFLKEYNIYKPVYTEDLTDKPLRMTTRWKKRMVRTRDTVNNRVGRCLNFDYHIPQIYNKHDFEQVISEVDYESDIGLCINTLYFNLSKIFKNFLYIYSIKGDFKYSFERHHNWQEDFISDKVRDSVFLGYNDIGLTEELKKYIQKSFPNKSRFER